MGLSVMNHTPMHSLPVRLKGIRECAGAAYFHISTAQYHDIGSAQNCLVSAKTLANKALYLVSVNSSLKMLLRNR